MILLTGALIACITQQPFTYKSENAVFPEKPNYVIVASCQGATPQLPAPPKPKPVPAPKPVTITLPAVPVEKSVPVKIEKEETIYFKLNSHALSKEDKTILDTLDKKDVKKITGYTCDLGSKDYNAKLARKRADIVAYYLGVSAPSVDIEGKGKCCYLDPHNRAKNRRVEITTEIIESSLTPKEQRVKKEEDHK